MEVAVEGLYVLDLPVVVEVPVELPVVVAVPVVGRNAEKWIVADVLPMGLIAGWGAWLVVQVLVAVGCDLGGRMVEVAVV